jgi:hypothetical protein
MIRALALFLVLALAACNAVLPTAPTFEVEVTKPEDSVTVTQENGAVVFEIESASGIGSARITRTAGTMPQEMVFRLHLRGLEHFQFAFDDDVVEVSVPSSGEHAAIVLDKNAGPSDTNPLTDSSSLWMPTGIVSTNPTIPLTDGYFEIRAPKAFLESDASSFAIDWIDFYR